MQVTAQVSHNPVVIRLNRQELTTLKRAIEHLESPSEFLCDTHSFYNSEGEEFNLTLILEPTTT